MNRHTRALTYTHQHTQTHTHTSPYISAHHSDLTINVITVMGTIQMCACEHLSEDDTVSLELASFSL